MRVVQIMPDKWAELSERAHLIVFNELKKPEMNRIDFALLVESKSGEPMQYAECRELGQGSLFMQYGGSFPGTKGTLASVRCFEEILEWAEFANYHRLSFLVENTNEAMLKLAMRMGFLITGIRVHKGKVFLENVLEMKPDLDQLNVLQGVANE